MWHFRTWFSCGDDGVTVGLDDFEVFSNLKDSLILRFPPLPAAFSILQGDTDDEKDPSPELWRAADAPGSVHADDVVFGPLHESPYESLCDQENTKAPLD